MNRASGLVATLNSRAGPFRFNASLFHASPVLERRRRSNWDSEISFKSSAKPGKFNDYYKRLRKRTLLHGVGDFAEHLFQSWKTDGEQYNYSFSQENSWFKPSSTKGGQRRDRSRNKTSKESRRKYEFCDKGEDDDFGSIFREAFGGNPCFYWTFTAGGDTRFRNSYRYHSRYEEAGGSSDEHETSSQQISSVSNRRALGLQTSGPLSKEDLKNAFHTCAKKWHPDKHQGSSKAEAEAKFKACQAAYESLRQELTLN